MAAELNNRRTARAANGARGKAACGPPHGGAAPWEDTVGTIGTRMGHEHGATSQSTPQSASGGRPLDWQVMYSPQGKPSSLGAGPSIGRVELPENGGGPATRGIERRRDGGAAPAADVSAARGSGGAAALGRREEMPLEGMDYRAHGARNSECQSLDAVHATLDESLFETRDTKRLRRTSVSPGRAPPRPGSSNDASGNEGRGGRTSRGGEGAAHASSSPPVDGSATRKKEEEEAAHPQQPRRCGGLQRRQPSILGSTDQPQLRRRRGSPGGKGPLEPHVSSEAGHDGDAVEGISSDSDPSPVCVPLKPLAEELSSYDSPIPRALLPAPRGEARDGVARRGEQQNGGQAGAAIANALTLGRPGAQGGLAHALHVVTRKRDAATKGGEPAGQVKRRRIRGKQSVRSVEATLSAPVSEEGQPVARATCQRARDDNAVCAIVDRPNSVHPPASAGASRSSSSVCDFPDFRVDRHGQALRSAGGAAGGVAAADDSGSGGFQERGPGDSGGGPSRYASHLLTLQCRSAVDHRDGPQPAASGAASVQSWSPSGGRPPDGAAYAV